VCSVKARRPVGKSGGFGNLGGSIVCQGTASIRLEERRSPGRREGGTAGKVGVFPRQTQNSIVPKGGDIKEKFGNVGEKKSSGRVMVP